MLVEDGSHSMDQPVGKTLGQVKLVFRSSQVIPEIKVTSIFDFLSLRESGRYVHLPGRSVTRLTAYHIYGMWLVLSNT